MEKLNPKSSLKFPGLADEALLLGDCADENSTILKTRCFLIHL